jgi:hypothetical protein
MEVEHGGGRRCGMERGSYSRMVLVEVEGLVGLVEELEV